MIYPEIVDFQTSDIYAGDSLTGHVPDISETGNSWEIFDGEISLQNDATELSAGSWGEPGAYFTTVSAMALLNMLVYKPRTFSCRFWVEDKTYPNIFICLRSNADFSEGIWATIDCGIDSSPHVTLYCTDLTLYPDWIIQSLEYDTLPAGAKIISYPNEASPYGYIDMEVIDDGIGFKIYLNNILVMTVSSVPVYLTNAYIGIMAGMGGGEYVAATSLNVVETGEVAFIEDAIRRLLYQYHDAENLKNIIRGLATQSYDEKETLDRILTREILATATGEQLDAWGNILGVARGAMTNTQYRAAIYLKIFINYSEGRIEDLIYVFYAFMNPTNVELTELAPATISLQANDPVIPDLESARLAIEVCKAAGIEIDSLSFSEGPAFSFLEYSSTDITTAGFDDGTGTVGGILSTAF
jgi:hypothetical protein